MLASASDPATFDGKDLGTADLFQKFLFEDDDFVRAVARLSVPVVTSLYRMLQQGNIEWCKELIWALYSFMYMLGTYSKPNKTRTVRGCLHRFCRECIDKSMRLGNNECPACRVHCSSRRSMRDDLDFDALIQAIYPDADTYEDQELILHEEEKLKNKQMIFLLRCLLMEKRKEPGHWITRG